MAVSGGGGGGGQSDLTYSDVRMVCSTSFIWY